MLLLVLGPERLWAIVPPAEFFLRDVLPFLISVLLAFVAARVIYQLGADVAQARELGSYRLDHRLGVGGMGEVWKASHQLLARPAAIKFIRPEAITGSNPEDAQALVRRFELEARATASLTSAHTVSLFDFGRTEDGAFYYVMELLEGLDLDDLVRRFGPLPPARVVHLLAQACESLDEAHARGLIHRDVKPANIYTCRSGSRCDFVKVLDFGLVAGPRPLTDDEARLTRPEEMTGTPDYMAPETARGEGFDGRADLYALGCVAYWLATGRLVFGGNTLYEIVSQHLHAAPEPPSRYAPAPLPGELEHLILACLAKDPADRPQSARALGERLRGLRLPQGWSEEDAERWWQANLPGVRPAAG
jgi:serine/threonine-protein kinase